MNTLQIGAGTTLDFTIPLPEIISNYVNVECEIFTDGNRPIKFSYIAKTGVNKLNVDNTNLIISGKLKSVDSLKLKGCVFMKLILTKTTGDNENIGVSTVSPILDPLTKYQLELC